MNASARKFIPAVLLAVLAASVACKRAATRTLNPYEDGTGSDIATRIQSVIASEKLCPNASSATSRGCVIDLSHPVCVNENCSPATSRDLIWLTNPVRGPNKYIMLLLGPYTYIACQPIVDGQTGYAWTGVNSPAQLHSRTLIRAGSVKDGCPENFPGGNVSPIKLSYQHGPFPAGTYHALMTQGGGPPDSDPIGRADTFAARVTNLQLDGNGLADFVYFSPAVEERSILANVSLRNCGVAGQRPWACAFYDREFQSGPSSGGGSGPSHSGMQDVTGTMAKADTDTSGVTVTSGVGYAVVQELGTTFIEFGGDYGPYGPPTAQAYGCTPATDPKKSYIPTAYATTSSGVPTPPILTNGGNCTTPPKSCRYLSDSGLAFSPPNVCALVTSGAQVTSISFPTPGGNYPTAQVPAGGLWLERATFTGTATSDGTLISWGDAMWFEGVYELGVYGPVHTERVAGDVVHYGNGSAPNAGGTIMGVSTTLGPGGCTVHFGNGFQDNSYTAISPQREISSGNVICDDNVRSGSTFVLTTSDTRRIPVYTGRSLYAKMLQLTPGKFADLPACKESNDGAGGAVIDGSTNAPHAVVTGGGTHHVPVYCDGTSWKVQ